MRAGRVGMPKSLYLKRFGELVRDAFGEIPYHVGSSLRLSLGEDIGREPHDVDVRVILSDDDYAAQGFGDPLSAHQNAKWVATCMAWSAFGSQYTGLPIDFQVQQQTDANARNSGSRSALLDLTRLKRARPELQFDSLDAPEGV